MSLPVEQWRRDRVYIPESVTYSCSMSSVAEIAAAMEALPEPERQRLESWFVARRYGDESALERELSAAIQEADAAPGAGLSPEEVRALIDRWIFDSASKNAR